jgi:catalase
VAHYKRDKCDDFTQPRALFHLFSPEEKARLFKNIAESMQGIDSKIQQRQTELFHKVDPKYGQGVEEALQK